MYWYNPCTRCTEMRSVPHTDEEATALLGGNINSGYFVDEYERLRDAGMSVQEALTMTGHVFRLKHLEFRAAR